MGTPELLSIPIRKQYQAKVLVAGEGKPIVFLHGAGGLRWDGYLTELAKEYKVYAPYFPGTGGTSGSNELDFRHLWDVVLFYFDLFDELGLEKASLIGHSFGGMLAAELAATDPKRVDQLVLICPTGLWDETIEKNFKRPKGDVTSRLFYDPESKAAKEYNALPEDPDERLEAAIQQQIAMAEANRYIWPLPDKGLNRRIHRIKAKTCIIWGKNDGVLPVEYAYEFQKAISDSRIQIIDKCSHYPQMEHPEQVIETTRSFLKENMEIKHA